MSSFRQTVLTEGIHFSGDKKRKWTLTASHQALLRYYTKFQSTSASYALFSLFGWSPTDGWCFPPSSFTSSLQIHLQFDSFWKGEKIACVKSSKRRLFLRDVLCFHLAHYGRVLPPCQAWWFLIAPAREFAPSSSPCSCHIHLNLPVS